MTMVVVSQGSVSVTLGGKELPVGLRFVTVLMMGTVKMRNVFARLGMLESGVNLTC